MSTTKLRMNKDDATKLLARLQLPNATEKDITRRYNKLRNNALTEVEELNSQLGEFRIKKCLECKSWDILVEGRKICKVCYKKKEDFMKMKLGL